MTYRRPDAPDEYPVHLRGPSDQLTPVEPGREHRVGRDARCEVVVLDPDAEWFHAVGLRGTANGCAAAVFIVKMTALTASETYECNGKQVIAVRWAKTKHLLPDVDPDNDVVGFAAVVDRLLAR